MAFYKSAGPPPLHVLGSTKKTVDLKVLKRHQPNNELLHDQFRISKSLGPSLRGIRDVLRISEAGQQPRAWTGPKSSHLPARRAILSVDEPEPSSIMSGYIYNAPEDVPKLSITLPQLASKGSSCDSDSDDSPILASRGRRAPSMFGGPNASSLLVPPSSNDQENGQKYEKGFQDDKGFGPSKGDAVLISHLDRNQGFPCIAVYNIAPHFTETDISKLFSMYGRVKVCHIIRSPNVESHCTGFVTMTTREQNIAAFNGLAGKTFGGYSLRIKISEILVELALLESQNKKRLLMAHQEQERMESIIAARKTEYQHREMPRIQREHQNAGIVHQRQSRSPELRDLDLQHEYQQREEREEESAQQSHPEPKLMINRTISEDLTQGEEAIMSSRLCALKDRSAGYRFKDRRVSGRPGKGDVAASDHAIQQTLDRSWSQLKQLRSKLENRMWECVRFMSRPPIDLSVRANERERIAKMIMTEIVVEANAVDLREDPRLRESFSVLMNDARAAITGLEVAFSRLVRQQIEGGHEVEMPAQPNHLAPEHSPRLWQPKLPESNL